MNDIQKNNWDLIRAKLIQVLLNIKDRGCWQSVDLDFRVTFSGRAGSSPLFWHFDSELTLFFFVICWDSKLLVRPLGGIRPGEVTLHKTDIFSLHPHVIDCVPTRILWVNTTIETPTHDKYRSCPLNGRESVPLGRIHVEAIIFRFKIGFMYFKLGQITMGTCSAWLICTGARRIRVSYIRG